MQVFAPLKSTLNYFNLSKSEKKHSLDPNSNMNIAIGPLVQSWRIGFEDAKVPTDEEVQNLLKSLI